MQIDWDAVATDPCLLRDIPNGHAARMQYSRFRSTIIGSEAQKKKNGSRNGDKGRPSKSRKGDHSGDESIVESESSSSLSSYARRSLSGQIKQEYTQGVDLSQLSPASFPSPYLGDSKEDFNSRFLTPCSDDMAPAMTVRSSKGHHGGQDVSSYGPPAMDCAADFMNASEHDHSPMFTNFDVAYDLDRELQTQHSLLDCDFDWNERFQDPNTL